MVLISANPGYSQVELSRIGNLDKSAIVTIVDDLEKRGLAIRGRSSSDRRRNSLFLTAQGEKLMKEMHQLAMATEQPLRDGSVGAGIRPIVRTAGKGPRADGGVRLVRQSRFSGRIEI